MLPLRRISTYMPYILLHHALLNSTSIQYDDRDFKKPTERGHPSFTTVCTYVVSLLLLINHREAQLFTCYEELIRSNPCLGWHMTTYVGRRVGWYSNKNSFLKTIGVGSTSLFPLLPLSLSNGLVDQLRFSSSFFFVFFVFFFHLALQGDSLVKTKNHSPIWILILVISASTTSPRTFLFQRPDLACWPAGRQMHQCPAQTDSFPTQPARK